MGLFDFFRAKWKHSNPEVRADAVRSLSADDTAVLLEVAKTDRDARVRKIAIKRLDDPKVLLDLAKGESDESVAGAARDKAVDLLMAAAIGKDGEAAVRAVALLEGARDLGAVARRGATAQARKAALARVTDDKLLLDVALKGEHDDAAGAAAERVTEQTALEQIAQRASSKSARSAAKDKLPRKKEVEGAAKAAKVVDKTRRARLLQVCLAAEAAVRGTDLEAAEVGLAAARVDWDDIGDDAADDKLRQRWSKLGRELEVRKVQAERDAKAKAAKEAEAAAAKRADHEAKRAAAAAAAVAAAPAPAPAPIPTPAPTPEPVVETEEQLAAKAAAAAEKAAAEAARAAAEAEKAAAERAARLKTIEKAVESLERRASSDDIKGAEGALRSSHDTMRLFRRSPDPEETVLRDRLVASQDKLNARITEHKEAQRWKAWANLPKLEELCKEAEALAEVIPTVEDKRRAPALLKDLNDRWRIASKGAPSERSKALWERFKKACDQVHDQCKEFFVKLDEERGENARKKEELCVRVEALIDSAGRTPAGEVNWRATSDAVKKLQDEWKAAGPTERTAGDALWKRFRAACDTFFSRRDAQDKERDGERAENLRRREEICAKVETLADHTGGTPEGNVDWRATAEAVKQLQEEWKSIGEGPRGTGGALWKRFRAACDRFFEARNAAFGAKDEERATNLQKKLLLCEKAEALASAIGSIDDREGAIDAIKAIQGEWRTIGPVPRAESDDVWRRFRAACDTIYDAARTSEDEEVEPPPPDPTATGISGFVNRLPLEGLLGKVDKPGS